MADEMLTAHAVLRVGGDQVTVDLTVPRGSASAEEVLPVFWSIARAIEEAATKREQEAGRMISCRAGCAACCRQLVPISEVEARMLSRLVEAQEEPVREMFRERFRIAIETMERAGLLEMLREPATVPREQILDLGLRYFVEGLPCPFLIDEACSIHEVRPLVCREYLVTNPAENCEVPTKENIQRVPLGARLSGLLARLGDDERPGRTTWVPLILALEWARRYPDDVSERSGPEWVRQILKEVSGQDLPAPVDTV